VPVVTPLSLKNEENIFFSFLRNFENDETTYLKFYTGSRMLREYSYHSFYERVVSFAAYLQKEKHISKNDKVAVSLGNSDFALIAYSAIMLLGAVIVPLDPSLEADELEYILDNSQSQLTITSNYFDNLKLELDCELSELSIYDTALLVYTSGTTSKPKGVVLNYKNLFSNAQSVVKHHKITSATINMCILPLFHVNAFNLSYFTSLYSKSKLILNKNFYLPNFWDIVEREKVNIVSMVPKVVNILLEDKRVYNRNLPNLNYFISAAAPLSKESAMIFYKRYKIRILQGYGMSEAVNFSATMPIDLDDKEYEELLDEEILSIGVAIDKNEIHVLGEDDTLLGEGELGEIAIRGDNVMSGYYNNEQATQEALKNGYLHTGDRGFFKLKNGLKYYYLVGRTKEIIIKNGENIAPLELDERLKSIKGLEQSVVVGFENKYTGEEIGLYVVKNSATPKSEDILKECEKALGANKAPKVLVFGDDIPTTPTGKIQRLKLVHFFDNYKDIYYK